MNALQYSVRHEPPLKEICRQSVSRKQKRRIAPAVLLLTTLVLLMLSTACAPLPPAPCEAQPVISKPAPDRLLPTQSYSASADKSLSEYQKTLTTGPRTP